MKAIIRVLRVCSYYKNAYKYSDFIKVDGLKVPEKVTVFCGG